MAMELLLLPSSPAIHFRYFPPPPPPPSSSSYSSSSSCIACCDRNDLSSITRRETVLKTGTLTAFSAVLSLSSSFVPATIADTLDAPPDPGSSPSLPPPRKPLLPGIASTKSWFLYIGNGFSIRVPPSFEDVTEPEDYNAGLSLYGDKVKPKTFAAQFASPDRCRLYVRKYPESPPTGLE